MATKTWLNLYTAWLPKSGLKRGLLFIWVVLFLGGTGWTFQTFRVQAVVCTYTSGQSCSAELQLQLHTTLANRSLLFSDLEGLYHREVATATQTELHQIIRQLPDQLTIVLESSPPLGMLLRPEKPGKFWVLLENGTAASTTASVSGIPQITVQLPTEDDQPLAPQYIPLIQSLSLALAEQKLPVQTAIVLSPDEVQIPLSSGQVALVDLSDSQTQISRLTTVINASEFATQSGKIAKIDMRFKLPVVTWK